MQRINKRRCRSGILSFRGFLWHFWFALFSIWNCWIIDQKLQGSRQVWWIKWQKNSISTGVERTVLRRYKRTTQQELSIHFIFRESKIAKTMSLDNSRVDNRRFETGQRCKIETGPATLRVAVGQTWPPLFISYMNQRWPESLFPPPLLFQNFWIWIRVWKFFKF